MNALVCPAQASPLDCDQAVADYGRWIKHEALRVHACMPWSDVDDLVQWGVVALLESLKRFDASLGTRFASFAKPRVRGAMLDSLRREGCQQRNIHRAPMDVIEGTVGTGQAFSDPLDDLLRSGDEAELAKAVAVLTNRQQLILQLIYVEGVTNKEAARVLGTSESYTSRTRRVAVARLRELLRPAAMTMQEHRQ